MFTHANVVNKLREFLDYVQSEPGIAGALLWSMYFHHNDGGFYWHQIMTYPAVWSYHWPGFPNADAQREIGIMTAMREAAFRIEGKPVPPMPAPDAPELLPIGDVPFLSWRGSAGATGYDIARAPKASGPWKTIAANVCDGDVAYRPLYSDTTVRAGQTWFYRVTARNASGASKPSNVVGPVKVKRVCFVDELQDFSRVQAKSDGLMLNNDYNALYAEYLFRAKGNANDWLSYQVPGSIESVKVVAFFAKEIADLTLQVSADGKTFAALQPKRSERRLPRPPGGAAGKQQRTMVEYECVVPAGNRQLKVLWNGPAELGPGGGLSPVIWNTPMTCSITHGFAKWLCLFIVGMSSVVGASTPKETPVFIFDDGWFEEQGYRCWDAEFRWRAVPDDLKAHAWLTLYVAPEWIYQVKSYSTDRTEKIPPQRDPEYGKKHAALLASLDYCERHRISTMLVVRRYAKLREAAPSFETVEGLLKRYQCVKALLFAELGGSRFVDVDQEHLRGFAALAKRQGRKIVWALYLHRGATLWNHLMADPQWLAFLRDHSEVIRANVEDRRAIRQHAELGRLRWPLAQRHREKTGASSSTVGIGPTSIPSPVAAIGRSSGLPSILATIRRRHPATPSVRQSCQRLRVW